MNLGRLSQDLNLEPPERSCNHNTTAPERLMCQQTEKAGQTNDQFTTENSLNFHR